MPCRDDRAYEDAFDAFMKLRKICMEFDTGYKHAVYSTSNHQVLTQAACEHFTKYGAKDFSLEAQIWWRDHQIADKKREKQLENEKKDMIALNRTLKSLTEKQRVMLRKYKHLL